MKKRKFLLIILILAILVSANVKIAGAEEFELAFDNIISFSIDKNGDFGEISNEHIVYYPNDGGVFYVELLVPSSELPPELTKENEQEVLKTCIDKMSGIYTDVFVPRQDIVRTMEADLFHIQDVSFNSETDYLVFSDGVLIWTPKGVVALWFSSFPGNYIQDRFVESILGSLKLLFASKDNDSERRLVFSSTELKKQTDKEKLHFIVLKSNNKFRQRIELFEGSVIEKPAYILTKLSDINSKEWMKNRDNRTKFSVIALLEAVNIESSISDLLNDQLLLFTGRKSNSVISSFVFTGTKVITISYDETSKKISVMMTPHSDAPLLYLEKVKSSRHLSSYYENDIELAVKLIKELSQSFDEDNQKRADGTSIQPAAPTSTPSTPFELSGQNSHDFKELLDSFEAFFDEYIEFMRKYTKSENPLALLADYGVMMSKYAETMEKLDEIDEDKLSISDQAYYFEVVMRINQKLMDAYSE